MRIYLAGIVPKGDKEKEVSINWRAQYQSTLESVFPDAQFIDPYHRDVDESDFLYVFGKDCLEVKNADLIIVNAENKLGVGTSQEMVIAKYFNKKVLTVLPRNSYHRRPDVKFHGVTVADWIHPFIFAFSDMIVESVEELGVRVGEVERLRPKHISIIDTAIKYTNSK